MRYLSFAGLAVLQALVPTVAYAFNSVVCTTNSDCLNGGFCNDFGGLADHTVQTYCKCASGFMGTHCESTCPLFCQNGGQCDFASDEHAFVVGATDFVCDCPASHEGILCDLPAGVVSVKDARPVTKETSSPVDGLIVALVVCLALVGFGGVLACRVRVIRSSRQCKAGKCTSDGQATGKSTDNEDALQGDIREECASGLDGTLVPIV